MTIYMYADFLRGDFRNNFITKLTVKCITVEGNHDIFNTFICYKLGNSPHFINCTIQYHTVLIHTVRWWAHVMRESVVASSVSPVDVGGAPDSLDGG